MTAQEKDVYPWQQELSIVIPAYNEGNAVEGCLRELKAALPLAEIIVVDDGSRDETAARAASVDGVTVISHRYNRGYGAALKTAMRAASRDYVVWFDADNEHRVEDLIRIVETLHRNRLVVVIGQRGRGGVKFRMIGKAAIRLLAWGLGFSVARDLNCGLRAFRRDVILQYLPLLPNRYSASMTSTMIMFARGYPMGFEPITVRKRVGHSKVVLSDGFQALALVLRMIVLFSPLRIFLTAGTAMVVVGLIYGFAAALTEGGGIPSLAVMTVITGVVLFLQGLIADQISYMRLSELESDSPTPTIIHRRSGGSDVQPVTGGHEAS